MHRGTEDFSDATDVADYLAAKAAIAPAQVVAARNSYGGTGFEQIDRALKSARDRLSS